MTAQVSAVQDGVYLERSHIVLETLDEAPNAPQQSSTEVARFELKNPFRGTRTALTLYKGGVLAVRTDYWGRWQEEETLSLRYLDPRPRISRVLAPHLLYPAAGAAALAGGLAALASLGVLSAAPGLLAAFALGMVAGVLTWLFLGQTGETAVFRTAHGHADVLVLLGTLGSRGALRRIVPAIVAAIREAVATGTEKQVYLREEMREHYRLAQAGVISEEECSTCTQRILDQFA